MSDAYRHITTNVDTEVLPEQDVVAAQAKLNWLASDITQRVVKDIIKQSDSLVADAIGLALVNHQSDNSKQIVHKLIQAETLRKVVEKYATRK